MPMSAHPLKRARTESVAAPLPPAEAPHGRDAWGHPLRKPPPPPPPPVMNNAFLARLLAEHVGEINDAAAQTAA